MCQAFEPATSTQDKSLSAVGLPTRITRRATRSPAARFFLFPSLSLFLLFLFYSIFSSCYSDYVTVTSMPFPYAAFAFCSILLEYVSRFKLVTFFVSRVAFLKGRRILGYLGRHSTPWIPEVSRIPGSSILESFGTELWT